MKGKVIWVSHQPKTNNSAIELGEEFLEGRCYDFFVIPSSPISFFKVLLAMAKEDSVIYYQISNVRCNVFIAFLLLIGRSSIAVHYLDDIASGYPCWAKALQLNKLIFWLLKKSQFKIFISMVMLRYYRRRLKLEGNLKVYFRLKPDGDYSRNRQNIIHKSCCIYAGAINYKTNLNAIKDASMLLQKNGYELHIYTRSSLALYSDLGDIKNVTIFDEVSKCDIITLNSQYEAILLPFNRDSRSKAFYLMSTPSKLPNIIMSQRPILYFGPKKFWLFRRLLNKFPKLCFQFDDYFDTPCGEVDISASEALYTLFKSDINCDNSFL